MARTAAASASSTLRMRLSMAPDLSWMVSPAADRVDRMGEKVENLPACRRRPPIDQRREVRQERLVRGVVQRPPLVGQRDAKAAPILGMIEAIDQALAFELIDDTGHRAQPDVELAAELAHGPRALEIEDAQAVGLRHGERAVTADVRAAELIQGRELVEQLVELEQIARRSHE